MIRQPTEEQWCELEAMLDAQGGERPYRRIVKDGYAYVMSEYDLPPEHEKSKCLHNPHN
jgi:hypothetical protein